jgi:hypothetical protein
VEVQDLPLPSEQLAEAAFEEFDKNWEDAASKSGDKPSLMKVGGHQLQHMRRPRPAAPCKHPACAPPSRPAPAQPPSLVRAAARPALPCARARA